MILILFISVSGLLDSTGERSQRQNAAGGSVCSSNCTRPVCIREKLEFRNPNSEIRNKFESLKGEMIKTGAHVSEFCFRTFGLVSSFELRISSFRPRKRELSLLQIIDLDQTNTDAAALAGQDGGKLSGRQ